KPTPQAQVALPFNSPDPSRGEREPDPEPRDSEPRPASPLEARAEPPTTSGGEGVDRFQELDEVVMELAKLSEGALKAYWREHPGGDLVGPLEQLRDASADVRKAFRRATGTGFGGTLRRFLHEKDDQRQAKSEELKYKEQELIRRGAEIERLIEQDPPG